MKVGISKCYVECILGCTLEERVTKQKIEIDIQYVLKKITPPQKDTIENTVDYVAIFLLAKTLLEKKQFYLLETACSYIAEKIVQTYTDDIHMCHVILTKLNPFPGITHSYVEYTAQHG